MIDRSERYSPPRRVIPPLVNNTIFIHQFATGQDNAEGIGAAVERYNKEQYVCPSPYIIIYGLNTSLDNSM